MKELADKIWGKVEDYFFNNLCSVWSLVIGELLVFSLSFLMEDFLSKLLSLKAAIALRWATIVLSFAWVSFWLWYRKIPRGKDGKFVIVIAIRAENDKKKISLISDFKEKIEDLLAQKSLSDILDVVVLNEYHSNRLVPIFRKAHGTLDGLEVQKKLSKKTNGGLLIYGDVKDRVDGVEKCFLNLDAVLFHRESQKTSESIKEGFANLWVRSRCFDKNREFHEFRVTAEVIFHATRYVVGMALGASGHIDIALKLHESLYDDFSKLKVCPPNILHIKNKLKELLIEENFILAHYYFRNGDFITSEKHLVKSMQIGKSYSGYLLQSNLDFAYKSDARAALESLKKAKEISKNDGTWRYNKGFLMMFREKFSEALQTYRQIAKPHNAYQSEELTLNEVCEYNENFLIKNPNKIWPNFIIGFLKYKKIGNAVDAYGYFEKFLKEAEGKDQYQDLVKEANLCVAEIKKDNWD